MTQLFKDVLDRRFVRFRAALAGLHQWYLPRHNRRHSIEPYGDRECGRLRSLLSRADRGFLISSRDGFIADSPANLSLRRLDRRQGDCRCVVIDAGCPQDSVRRFGGIGHDADSWVFLLRIFVQPLLRAVGRHAISMKFSRRNELRNVNPRRTWSRLEERQQHYSNHAESVYPRTLFPVQKKAEFNHQEEVRQYAT